ncbi:salicylate hydroxylase [Favolaschia claudopus]|uniref:Salicylate hydroxylase n=1 Tax=Favolaschia claudopus TaxID=2862362 RepID=A0AAW0BG13_9AGAR
MQNFSSKRLRVAICGAGIGGLTLAVALAQYPDIDIELYEAANSLTELGAGIGLFPRPWKIIQMLGLEDDLLMTTERKPRQGPVPAFNYRKSDQQAGFTFSTLVTNGTLITLHRADFQAVLLKRLPRTCRVNCSKRLRTYTQRESGTIELIFEDNSRTFCDVLVGADGLKSATRATFLTERANWMGSRGRIHEAADVASCIDPVWSGTVAYRALIPGDRLSAAAPGHSVLTSPTQYLGKNGYIIAYPISHGKMINFVAFVCRHDLENTKFDGPWTGPCDKSQFAGVFAHWEPEVHALIHCIDKCLRWAIHTMKPLRSFVSGNTVLIGDAAHAMTPHQGSGAGQAIEDAYILATVLGHRTTSRETVPRALRVFDEIRRPLATGVVEASRMNGRFFSLEEDGGIGFDQYTGPQLWEKLQKLHSAVVQNWEWTWTTSVDGSIQEALRRLEGHDCKY